MSAALYTVLEGRAAHVDGAYTAAGLRPNAGRITHGSRALLLSAHHALGAAKGVKKAQMGLCLSVRAAAGESYCGFRDSVIARDMMPRHYAVAVPNAPTSELSLQHRIKGPAVTLAEAEGAATACPQLLLALDWLETGVTDHVMIGALEVDAGAGASRCLLLVLDRDLAGRCAGAQAALPPMPSGFDFLDALASETGLTKAQVPLQ